jgi:hypothetical protein
MAKVQVHRDIHTQCQPHALVTAEYLLSLGRLEHLESLLADVFQLGQVVRLLDTQIAGTSTRTRSECTMIEVQVRVQVHVCGTVTGTRVQERRAYVLLVEVLGLFVVVVQLVVLLVDVVVEFIVEHIVIFADLGIVEILLCA